MRKYISIFLIMAILVGIVGTYPITATANEEVTVPDGIFTTAGLATIGNYNVTAEQKEAGVKVTYSDSASKWARVGVQNKYEMDEKGVHIEVTDIATASDTYAFAMHFGNYTNVFFSERGYVLVYENSGKFSIVATKHDGAAVDQHKIVLEGKQLEPLDGNLTIDIKLVGDNYVIGVNGHPFRIPAVHSDENYCIQNTSWAQFSFAFVGESRAHTAFPGATYTIKSITPITYFIEAELATIGNYNVTAEQKEAGVKVTYSDSASKWARVGVQDKYKMDEKGVHIEVTDIATASDTYAFAMHFGNYTNVFFSERGYVLVYENSGKFSIVATKHDGAAVDQHKIVLEGKQLNPLNGNLTIDIKLVGDNYVITVNGNSYTIPAVHSEESYYIQDTSWAQFSFAFVGESRAHTAFPGATYTIKSITPITYDVDEVTLDSSSKTMKVNEKSSLTASVVGENVQNTAVTWASSDTSIATVNADGNVTAHLAGTVSITATSVADTTKSAACEVKVTEEEVSQEIFTLAKLADIGTSYYVGAEQKEAGVRVTYSDSASKWARVGVKNKYTTDEKGVRIEVTDIETASDTYAFAMHFGNYTNVFFGERGYVLVYENSGKFSIVATKHDGAAVDQHKIVLAGKQLDPLNGKLTIDIKLVGDNYVIIVNGHSFTIPAVHSEESYYIQDTSWAQFSFAFVDTSRAAALFPGATYTIKSITPITDTEPQQPVKVIAYTSTFHNFRNETEMEVPIAPEGYVFAGWYSDAACEATPISPGVKVLEAGAKVYARFVPETVLSVKPQAKYSETDNEETDTNKIDLRFVTTVDSHNYQSVGFEVTNRAGNSNKYLQQYVFGFLVAAGVEYEPTYFNQLSTRFATIQITGITVDGTASDSTIKPDRVIPVRAYWITKDGTTVYGPERLVKISDAVASLQGNAN